MLAYAGLAIIIAAWAVQLSAPRPTHITRGLVGLYIVGVLVLVADGLVNHMRVLAALNAASGVVAYLVLRRIPARTDVHDRHAGHGG